MAKSKHGKNHKKKVAAWKKRKQEQANKIKKYQQRMLEEFIKKEQEKGVFDEAKIKEDPDADADIIVDGPELD